MKRAVGREPSEYAAARIPGAVSMLQANLTTRLDEIPRDREGVVVCVIGTRSPRSARVLHAVGYARLTNLDGGTNCCPAARRATAAA